MPRTANSTVPPFAALGTFLFAVLLMFALAPFAGNLWMGAGVQAVALGVPALLVASRFGPPMEMLGLTKPPLSALAAATLLGLSFWLVNLLAVGVPAVELFGGHEEIATLSESFSKWPLWQQLVVGALVPAVCEELLVRGVLVRGLAPRLGTAKTIVVTAALFGILHFPVARMFPAAATGALLAYIAIRSGSLWPAVLAHLLNNTMALVGTRVVDAPQHLTVLTVLAAAASLVGIRLLHRTKIT